VAIPRTSGLDSRASAASSHVTSAASPVTRRHRATDAAKSEIPAVVHVDGTGRVQRVDRESSPDLFELLTSFKQRTGVGVLLNTSMNLKDEPIVASPAEAYATFLRSDLDFLVLEDCLVTGRNAS